ncbi:MAG: hypothetical protein ABJ056_03870, partial [Halioglobus sp.]
LLKESSDRIASQGPNRRGQDLDYRVGTARVAVARWTYEGITIALPNSSSVYGTYDICSPSLAMAAVLPHDLPGDDLDKQVYQREYINAHMKEGEDPTILFESMGIIREKLAQVGIPKSDKEPNVHRQQRLTSEY